MNKNASPLKTLLVIALIAVATAGIMWAMGAFKPKPQRTPAPRVVAVVEAVSVQPETLTLTVQAQGTAVATTRATLSAQASGEVLEVSPKLMEGASFNKGDVLIKIDPADAAVALAQAKLNYEQALANSKQAQLDWEENTGSLTKAPPLALRTPQLALAQAQLTQAQRNVNKATLRAPFKGRVLQRFAHQGSLLSAGAPIAEVYALEGQPGSPALEVPLPLTAAQHANIVPGAKVTLTNPASGATYTASLTRLGAQVHALNRTHTVFAGIEASEAGTTKTLPLPGAYLHASIAGRTLQGAYKLPRAALKGSSELIVMDSEDKLRRRLVQVAQSTPQFVYVTGGLTAGERVVTSAIEYFVDGMPAQVKEVYVGGE